MGKGKSNVDPRAIGSVVFVVLFVSSFLLGFSWRVVSKTEYGIKVNELSWAVQEKEAYESGRHFTGLGNVFQTFKKTVYYFDALRLHNATDVDQSDAEDSVGSLSGETSGPITVRTRDGQQVDIEVSMQVRVNKTSLYTLYTSYGTDWENFMQATVRARIRDECARFTSSEFFTNRMVIESQLERVMAAECTERYVELVGLQLKSIDLPADLDNALKTIQLSKITLTLTRERLKTLRITSNTSKMITEMTAQRDSEFLVLNQQITNLRQQYNLANTEVLQTTDKLKTIAETSAAKEVAEYDMDTETRKTRLQGNLSVAQQSTLLQVTMVQNQINELRANTSRNVSEQLAAAAASRESDKSVGEANALKAISRATREKYAQIAADGLARSRFVALEFGEVVSQHPADRMYMDQQKPDALYLPGQKDSQIRNMRSGRTVVV